MCTKQEKEEENKKPVGLQPELKATWARWVTWKLSGGLLFLFSISYSLSALKEEKS